MHLSSAGVYLIVLGVSAEGSHTLTMAGVVLSGIFPLNIFLPLIVK